MKAVYHWKLIQGNTTTSKFFFELLKFSCFFSCVCSKLERKLGKDADIKGILESNQQSLLTRAQEIFDRIASTYVFFIEKLKKF